jgi:ribonuclease BN (tRNA processing enzyme)
MQAPYFPAPAAEWRGITGSAILEPGEVLEVGNATIRTGRLCHPGLTLGFRIEEEGYTFVYASDNEPAIAPPELFSGIVDLAAGADLLLHDCQYNDAEYQTRHGWGHSTPQQATRVAAEAGVRRLLMFHHDPAHSDEQVEALADEVRALAHGFEVLIAREGETIDLAAHPALKKRERMGLSQDVVM